MNAVKYETLSEVNERLVELGLQKISPQQAAEIQKAAPKSRLVQALREASSNTGAMNFLRRLIPANQGSQNAPQTAPAANQSGPQQRQSSSQPARAHQGNNPPASNRPQNQAPAQPQGERRGDKDYTSHHVYGGKAALTWSADETRNGEPTIRLEGAKSIGERQYDWSNKIAVQFTRDELTCAVATLTGALPKMEGKNHGVGDQTGKGFEIVDQGTNFFVKVFAPNAGVCAVPMTPEDAFTVTSIILKQMRKGKPWLSGQDLIMLAARTVGRMKK
ncbi:hypothetical protein [Marinobacter sp. P4B1]|uniref:hypothetical protein n=1 Tax=Marinobacter sp. P4B1 TaxID=1119533 RepID=UPI00071DF807|nr:hypothetical protein [Marinobacter sp. P4B1]KRW83764.1 hypothetical protein AQ621_17085 [Marinobacter sp. P4B1]